MHSSGRRHTAADSRRANGRRAEPRGKTEEVEKRLGEMFQLKE